MLADFENMSTLSSVSQVKTVKRIFNEMVGEYDRLLDLWYRYLYDNIDHILLKEFQFSRKMENKPLALDVGCGTGIQSLRLASMGYGVIGIDIADTLLRRAKIKLSQAGYDDAQFCIADAQSLPFKDQMADCMNCCGATLSFVPKWRKALSEMARCLKLDGKLLLEVEGKWNLDLFWEIINAAGFNFLGYDEPLSIALSHLLQPWNNGPMITYSFKTETGKSVSMRLKLFTTDELKQELQSVGVVQNKLWGLHVLTNLIPSTILHKSNPGKLLRVTFGALAFLEKRVYSYWPFHSLGCSLLVLAHKRKHKKYSRRTRNER